MSLLLDMDGILKKNRKEKSAKSRSETSFVMREKIRREGAVCAEVKNILAKGDNLEFMRYLADAHDMKGKIDFIYIDPPFFSKANYTATTRIRKKETGEQFCYTKEAYEDTWENGAEEYLDMITERLVMMRELLRDSGCIFIHLDWHIVHYVKVIADSIFGPQNFINEIIWSYKSGGAGKRHFGRKHDTILLYGKTKKYTFYPQKEKSYNRNLRPYYFKGVQEFQDEVGWYTMVNMKDVWTIDMVGRTSGERVDYATQKPEALIERMIKSCTAPGDLCADFFAGSGTLASAAEKMGRSWICCDSSKTAMARIQKRLCQKGSEFDYYEPMGLHSEESSAGDKDNDEVKVMTSIVRNEKRDQIKVTVNLEAKKEHIIDHWSIDYNFDGIHSPQVHFFRQGDAIQTTAERMVDKLDQISIKITDIAGDVRYLRFSF